MDDDDAPAAAAAPDAASASTGAWSGAIAAAASSSSASGPGRFVLNLPPGYHFLPTNAELVLHYLRPRLANHRLPLPIFFDEHILHYHPDRLIEKYREYGEDRWFFFTRRERKHAGGSRPNRATPDNGHWNATGCPKRICAAGGELVGRMRTLVFYEAPRTKKKMMRSHGEAEAALPPMPPAEEGEASKGAKTEWTMYEYESIVSEEEFLATSVDGKMDAIVLCTIQKKKQKKKEEEEGNEGETTKKRTRGRAKEKGHEQAVPADGKKQERKKRKLTAEAPEEDQVQRTLTETEEALERELALEAFTGVANNFTVDPNANMPRCFFANTPSSPLPTLPLDTMTMASAATGDNHHISAHPSTAAMENYSQFWQFQAPASGQELLVPYFHTKILAPPLGGGNNNCGTMAPRPSSWMDGHFASNQTAPPPPPPPLLREVSTASWIYTPHTTPYNTAKIVPSADLYGFAPGLSNSNSNYGGFAGDGHRLSSGFGGRLDLLGISSFPPLQPSFGAGSGSSTQGGGVVHSKLSVEGWRFLLDTQGSSAPKGFGPKK